MYLTHIRVSCALIGTTTFSLFSANHLFSRYEHQIKSQQVSLSEIPYMFRTKNICHLAINKDGLSLPHVPKTITISKRTYQIAIRNNGLALQFVPSHHLDFYMCMDAVRNNGLALQYVPHRFIDQHMCITAFENNENSHQFIPKQFQHVTKN